MDSSFATQPEASTVHRVAAIEAHAERETGSASAEHPRQVIEEAQTVIRGEPRRNESAGDGSASSQSAAASDRPRASDSPDRPEPPLSPEPQTPAALTRGLEGQSLNHFRLIEQIGGGGMGAVFRAVDERLGRTVAVKVIPFAQRDPDLQRRFRNEAQSAAKLDHPMIARVFEVGSDGPWHYIVFEYIDGQNIRDIVVASGPLSIDDAVFYTCQLAEAIGHASRRGIVHRDVKPSNVIVTAEGPIKLVDMGLARSDSFDASEDLTASGVTLGTFDYISPEQARDPRLADVRSDLYSLGCTLYFMLTGSPPFPGGTMLQKLLSHGNAAIPDVRQSRSDASSDLAAILKKMLAKQPEQRYQDTADLIADLVELAARENLPRTGGVPAVATQRTTDSWASVRRHLPWMVAAGLLVISAAWLELMAWQTRRDFAMGVASTVSARASQTLPISTSTSGVVEPVNPQANATSAADTPPAAPSTGGPPPANLDPRLFPPASLGASGNSATTTNSMNPGDSSVTPPSAANFPASESAENFQPLVGPRTASALSELAPSGFPDATVPIGSISLSGGSTSATATDSLEPASLSVTVPSVTNPSASLNETSRSTTLSSDPPSLQGFPLPASGAFPVNAGMTEPLPREPSETFVPGSLGSAGSDGTNSNAESAVATPRSSSESGDRRGGTPSPATLAMLEPLTSGGTLPSGAGPSTGRLDNTDLRSATLLAPSLVRVVGRSAMSDPATLAQANADRAVLVDSLADAIRRTETLSLDRIDLATPLVVCDPLVLTHSDLLITSSAAGGTAVVFRSSDEIDMQRSDMVTLGSNRVEFVDLHFYWTVPASETDGGSLFSVNENRQVRLTDCTITIDNPSRRDQIHAFHIETDALATDGVAAANPSTSVSSSDRVAVRPTTTPSLPLVSIELYNVIVRGQISMIKLESAAELQLLWENGLLAVSRRMLETGGSPLRPRPTSSAIQVSLSRVTALVPLGLVRMQIDSNGPYPVVIDRRAEESVFVVDHGCPHVEIVGLSRTDREGSWLKWRGGSNAYETDSSLGDPVLTVRDEFGQQKSVILSDLLQRDAPTWADDRTPRWVVRWSQPLPATIPASRLLPADFRQDGSLVGGFQERSLPRLPMERSFDFAPPG